MVSVVQTRSMSFASCLVSPLAAGLDLFYTRTSPSGKFDLLSDDFSYALLGDRAAQPPARRTPPLARPHPSPHSEAPPLGCARATRQSLLRGALAACARGSGRPSPLPLQCCG